MNKEVLQKIARQAGCFPGKGETSARPLVGSDQTTDPKLAALIAVGIAVAMCCLTSFEAQVHAAQRAGASQAELTAAVQVGKMIRQAPMDEIDKKWAQLVL